MQLRRPFISPLCESMKPATATDQLPQANHILVDFENVRKINLSLIGHQAVHITLLLGSCDKKLDVEVVEKLWEHAASVQLVRLTSAGKNALDFALAYYLGRAVLADPTGSFHLVTKDKGYDPLIEHLRSRQILAQRHDDFTTLDFLAPAPPLVLTKPPAATQPAGTPKPKPPLKTTAQSHNSNAPRPPEREKVVVDRVPDIGGKPTLDAQVTQVLEHLRKPSTPRPKTRTKLVSFLVANFGHKIIDAEALAIVETLCSAGHITLSEKGGVTYQL